MRASQMVFGWFEMGMNRSGVLSLCVFRPEVIKDKGHDGSVVHGGQQKECAYETWLRWFSPLSAFAGLGEWKAPEVRAEWLRSEAMAMIRKAVEA